MDRFALLLAGRMAATPALFAALAGRRVIAADGGIAHAMPLEIEPEIWVGDFDSVPETLPPRIAATPRREWPAEKDATDGELALAEARERGARDVLVIGGLGGRSDHAFSNMVMTLGAADAGLIVELFDGVERAVPLGPQMRTIAAREGQTFSVLRFGDVEGLTVTGARWSLHDVDLPLASTLTQSNEATGPVGARVRRGHAILMMQETAFESR
ncbi:thiamine diphosphokinase [Aureimonas mangrovi]|uniref:thiamine diphosphokinase n=1 Tax=Aureimonas mangrovi TaxID=2758041 RepID=UPI00163D6022|nr:thiamine diphosphokinase [Aureimonas mangrovi]